MLELRDAAFRGDLDTVSLYKKQRDRVNEAGPETQRTALHWAAWGGHHDVASCLLKAAKAEVDPLDLDDNTPLNLAIQTPNSSLAKKLLVIDLILAHNADPTKANKNGETPLMSLMQLSRQMSPTLGYHREVMKGIMRKVEKNIREKAERENLSYTVLPNGEVTFEALHQSRDFTVSAVTSMRMHGLQMT